MKFIADGLLKNQNLQELDLRNNKITGKGAQALLEGIKNNTTLKKLGKLKVIKDLRWNNIGIVGGRAILELLKRNSTLIRLEITGNEVPDDLATAISILYFYPSNGNRKK